MAQAAAGLAVLRRLARGRDRHPPLSALGGRARLPPGARAPRDDGPPAPRISVVVPARDEAGRIGGCLPGVLGDPAVGEVLVVDDASRDGTAEVARALGARVVEAGPLPAGWVGKPWALQRGLQEARHDVVVSLDADTVPAAGLAAAMAAALDDADLVCAGARFRCEQPGERLLHPAMLASLVYRYGPPDAVRPPPVRRLLANGQCTAVRRSATLDAGGYAAAAGHMTDDAAFARDVAGRGGRVVFREAGDLVAVDMHDSAVGVWREWGRSIALPDVTARTARAGDLATVWLVLALPVLRALAGRATHGDRALLLLRLAMLVATRGSYEHRGLPFWCSPLADPLAAVRLTTSALRPTRTWRGREYGRAG